MSQQSILYDIEVNNLDFFVLTQEHITELQQILQEDFGVTCSREETLRIAMDLLGFFEALTCEDKEL